MNKILDEQIKKITSVFLDPIKQYKEYTKEIKKLERREKMKISIYELMGLIKDDKAPKQINILGITFYFNDDYYSLENIYKDDFGETWFQRININLGNTVEILQEENDEWEDIEEIDSWKFNTSEADIPHFELSNKINSLIRNQKYLKEKLEEK